MGVTVHTQTHYPKRQLQMTKDVFDLKDIRSNPWTSASGFD